MSTSTEYKVKKGDTLSAIAKKYGTTYQEIAKANGIKNPDLIYAGQVLNIGGTEPAKPPATKPPLPAGKGTGGNTNGGTKETLGNGNGGTKEEPSDPTPSPPPETNTTESGFTYEEFAPSDETTAAGANRDTIMAAKPGDFTYGTYAKSDAVLNAEALLNEWYAGRPGEYTPVWLDEANGYLSQYEDRDPFSYDFNSDALYNQYKDQYVQQGRMAMMDTMGQAAAMTGGYGNSYAQTVGQQAYNQQLGQLNEIMPELYGMAYDRYNQEGQDLLNMYGIYMDKENAEYGKYQDNLNNWYTHLDYLSKDARYKGETEYNQWLDSENMRHEAWQDGYNSWLDEYNIADDNYWNLYNRDYSVYETDTGMAFDDYWKNEDHTLNKEKFEYAQDQDAKAEAKANQDREYNRISNLISNTGYTPTANELKAAGMTQAEAKAMQDAYTASTTKEATTEYKDLDIGSEAYNNITKSVRGATSLAELQGLVKQWLALGYNPDQIEALTASKAKELMPEEPEEPENPRRASGGGSGGGVSYIAHK